MTIDWTRIAVKLGNEARGYLDDGRGRDALERYREALKAMPTGRPTLDALFHYGLAEAHLLCGELAEARRAVGRSLRINARLANHEGLDAGRRLRALARFLAVHRPSPRERQEVDLLLDLGVRPLQYRLRAAGRAPRIAIHVWERLPAKAGSPLRSYRFSTDRLERASRAAARRGRPPSVDLSFRPGGERRMRVTLIEDLGGQDTIGRSLWLQRQGRSWSIRKERLIPI